MEIRCQCFYSAVMANSKLDYSYDLGSDFQKSRISVEFKAKQHFQNPRQW